MEVTGQALAPSPMGDEIDWKKQGREEADGDMSQPASMADLPTRCLEHIFHRLPLRSVYRVERVCREWRIVAAGVIRDWPVGRVYQQIKADDPCAVSIPSRDQVKAKAFIKSMMRLHHLQKLTYESSAFPDQRLDALMNQNAASLRHIACWSDSRSDVPAVALADRQ